MATTEFNYRRTSPIGSLPRRERATQAAVSDEVVGYFMVHDQLEFGWRLNRQFGRSGTT